LVTKIMGFSGMFLGNPFNTKKLVKIINKSGSFDED